MTDYFNPCPKPKYTKKKAKNKRWVSKKYREFVSRQRSVHSGKIDRNVPHHHRKGSGCGVGTKPSDSWCITLTYKEHQDFHKGNLILNCDEAKECLKLMTLYLIREGYR